MKLNLKSAELARVKAAYRLVFGHPVPYAACVSQDPRKLASRLDRAIRDMRPLDDFNSCKLIYPNQEPRPEPLPLSVRALVRWQYMQKH
jgi:hypothetical protein